MLNPPNLNRLIALLCLLYPSVSFAIVFGNGVGEVTLTGFTKLPDGTYARAFPNADIDLSSPPKGLSVKSTAVVPTSKGVFDFQITKTVDVDTSRLGSKVASFAKKVGPLGMALAAADLVCELTTICNQAGEWFFNSPYSDPDFFPPTAPIGHYISGGRNGTQAASALQSCKSLAGLDLAGSTTVLEGTSCKEYAPSGYLWRTVSTFWVNSGACPPNYAISGSSCVLTQNPNSGVATDDDWASKSSLLNDDRFTPHLLDAGEDVPTLSIPTLPPGQTKSVAQQSVPVRDSAGNVTGRDDSETVIEAVDAATAEAPGKVIIKETTITNRYDNSNTLISTSETTNYTAQTQETQPQSFEIKFDEVEPAQLLTYTVPDTFTSTSWGNGSCPDDVTVSISGNTFAIPSQPVCDTALMINPFVLLIASLIGVYIISGVRSGNAT